jgi:hypothetical protein
MRLDSETHTVILESKPCWGCSENGSTGKRYANEWQTCRECHGTGRGKRGGRRGCQKCHGTGEIIVQTQQLETCPNCHGTGHEPENNCDAIPPEWWESFTFKVYRQERNQTYNEYLLGIGCVYSCTDYGAAAGMSDEALIDKVKGEERYTQLCKVANKENRLADHIGIFVNRGGYSVRPVYDSDATDAKQTIARERDVDEGFRVGVGVAMARAGGNGTLGAIYK